MRASTFVFLGLFAAMVWSGRIRHDFAHGLRRVCDAVPACCPNEPAQRAEDPRASVVEREIRGLDQRSRDLEKSLQSIAGSERTLRDVVRRHPDDAVEQELAAIVNGGRRLRELKTQIATRRVVLQARLELVRAGLADEGEDAVRSSPVDALSSAAVPIRDY